MDSSQNASELLSCTYWTPVVCEPRTVSINVDCPECQNRFRLQDAMIGKTITCPTCRFAFLVKSPEDAKPIGETQLRTRSDSPKPNYSSGNVGDMVPLLSPTVNPTSKKTSVKPPKEIHWSELVNSPIKETTWSEETEPPAAIAEEKSLPNVDNEPTSIADETPRRSGRKAIVIFLSLVIAVVLGVGGYFGNRYFQLAPERLNQSAEKEYTAKKFDQARKLYEQFTKEYPNHPNAPKAQFFVQLSALRSMADSVMTRKEPAEAIAQWKKFLESLADPSLAPFAEKDRFGIDIWDTGAKLAEDALTKGQDVLAEDKLTEAEDWLKQAKEIENAIDRFRPTDAPRPEAIVRESNALQSKIAESKSRLTVLEEIKKVLGTEPDDDKLAFARQLASAKGYANNEGILSVIREGEKKLEGKATYTRIEPAKAPVTPAVDSATSLLFTPRLDRGGRRSTQGQPGLYFAVGRGVLYALDETDGRLVWASRVGADSDANFLKLSIAEHGSDMLIIPTSDGKNSGIAARSPRDGSLLWYQPLASPCLGVPVVIGNSVYLPLADKSGSIIEINLTSGDAIGTISLGRPIGIGAVGRMGTGFLYVAAEARAIYVFDCERRGANGERLDPQFLGTMNTGHPPGSLRNRITFTNPEPDAPGPKHLVICQADSLGSMRLRAFPLNSAEGKPDNSPAVVDLPLNGWSQFPPLGDGEKLAIVTDRGELHIFGLNLAGNSDSALFNLPFDAKSGDSDRAIPGQVVQIEESGIWTIRNGELQKLAMGYNGNVGAQLTQSGPAISVGSPLQPAQISPRGDAFFLVTQNGATIRALMVDAINGRILWRRELGLTVKGPPVHFNNSIIFLDPAGGIYRIEDAQFQSTAGRPWLTDERWMLSPPVDGYQAVTPLITTGQNSLMTMMQKQSESEVELVFRFIDANGVREIKVSAPARPAGSPVMHGKMCLLPLANGNLYRLNVHDGKALQEGPSWKSERAGANATCGIAILDENQFVSTDGNKTLLKWHWPNDSNIFETRGRLNLPEKPVSSPVVIPGEKPSIVICDEKGQLTLWDAEKFAPPLLRAWRPNEKGTISPGKLQLEPTMVPRHGVGSEILYSLGKKCYLLSPADETPLWISPEMPMGLVGTPTIDSNGIFALTFKDGRIWTYDPAKKLLNENACPSLKSYPVAAPAMRLKGGEFLVPLADGTLLKLPPSAEPAP